MKKTNVSPNLINPASSKEIKDYPYQRLDMHTIQVSKAIIGDQNEYRLIGNRGDKAADFFTTYAVFNQEFKEVTDKQTTLEIHELTMYLSLDFYMEGLQSALLTHEDDLHSKGNEEHLVTHLVREQDRDNLANLVDSYALVKEYPSISIEEARDIRKEFLTFWEGYKDRYQEIQRLPKTPVNEEVSGLNLEQMYLESLVYKLSEWLSDDVDNTAYIPDLIRLNGKLLHESQVHHKNDALSKLEKINVYLIKNLRWFMSRVYLPFAILIFIFTFNLLVFAFPLLYYFGLKQSLATLLPTYQTKQRKAFIHDLNKNATLEELNEVKPPYESSKIEGVDTFTLDLRFKNYATGTFQTALMFYGLGLFLTVTQRILAPLLVAMVIGTVCLILSFILPRLTISQMDMTFKNGEISIPKLSPVYPKEIGKLSINRHKKLFKISVGAVKDMERSFEFKNTEQLDHAIEKIKRWAEVENVTFEVL